MAIKRLQRKLIIYLVKFIIGSISVGTISGYLHHCSAKEQTNDHRPSPKNNGDSTKQNEPTSDISNNDQNPTTDTKKLSYE